MQVKLRLEIVVELKREEGGEVLDRDQILGEIEDAVSDCVTDLSIGDYETTDSAVRRL